MTLPTTWIKNNMLQSPSTGNNNNNNNRILTEAEMKVQRSLQKLSIPEWYLNSNSRPPKILMNDTPIESRPPSWKGQQSLNKTIASSTPSRNMTINRNGLLETEIGPPEIQMFGTYRMSRTSPTERSSVSKKQSGSSQKSDMPEKRLSRSLVVSGSQTFPRVSPSRKVQNINIVLPPLTKNPLSRALANIAEEKSPMYEKKDRPEAIVSPTIKAESLETSLLADASMTSNSSETKVPRMPDQKLTYIKPWKSPAPCVTPEKKTGDASSPKRRASLTPQRSPVSPFAGSALETSTPKEKKILSLAVPEFSVPEASKRVKQSPPIAPRSKRLEKEEPKVEKTLQPVVSALPVPEASMKIKQSPPIAPRSIRLEKEEPIVEKTLPPVASALPVPEASKKIKQSPPIPPRRKVPEEDKPKIKKILPTVVSEFPVPEASKKIMRSPPIPPRRKGPEEDKPNAEKILPPVVSAFPVPEATKKIRRPPPIAPRPKKPIFPEEDDELCDACRADPARRAFFASRNRSANAYRASVQSSLCPIVEESRPNTPKLQASPEPVANNSPSAAFFASKKKSTTLENIVKQQERQRGAGKSLVQEIIEELNEKCRISAQPTYVTPGSKNFVKKLVRALERGKLATNPQRTQKVPTNADEKSKMLANVDEKSKIPANVDEKSEMSMNVNEKPQIPMKVDEKPQIPMKVDEKPEIKMNVDEKPEVPRKPMVFSPVDEEDSEETESSEHSSEDDVKSVAVSTSISFKETDSSDSELPSPTVRRDFNYNLNTSAHSDFNRTITIDSETKTSETDEESVYWIPVIKSNLPRSSSLLSMISRFSTSNSGRQSPCMSPINKNNEGTKNRSSHNLWGVTYNTAERPKIVRRMNETTILDSGYSDRSRGRSSESSDDACLDETRTVSEVGSFNSLSLGSRYRRSRPQTVKRPFVI